MVLDTQSIVNEVMTQTPQAPMGTLSKDQVKPPLTPVKEEPMTPQEKMHQKELDLKREIAEKQIKNTTKNVLLNTGVASAINYGLYNILRSRG